MNKLQTMWSISRRKSLINCAHQYILRYSRNQNNSNYAKNSLQHSPTDLLVRSLRKIMIERLEDYKNGIIWSEKMLLLKIEYALKFEMGIERFNKIQS